MLLLNGLGEGVLNAMGDGYIPKQFPIAPEAKVFSPSDILDGRLPEEGPVIIWDDDHYYMAGVIAELLAARGLAVTYVTPASEASTWTRATMEQAFIQKRLLEKGIAVVSFRSVDAVGTASVTTSCVFTGRVEELAAAATVLVTARLPREQLALDLLARRQDWADAGIESVTTIGDALAPATIAHAVYAGRRYAEELDGVPLGDDEVPFRREITALLPR